MAPNDRVAASNLEDPDGLTPEQLRRFQLWRAVADLAKAQADGKLTAEQAQLLGALADSIQQLAAQLSQLAALSEQYVQALDPGRTVHAPPTGSLSDA